jgi:hypothetical protein
MVKLDLPYLWVTTGRHGRRRYWFYRRNGRFIPISSPDGRRLQQGEPGFFEAYERIHESFGLAARAGPASGSLTHLIDAYRAAPEFTTLKPKTRRDYGRYLDMLKAGRDRSGTEKPASGYGYRSRATCGQRSIRGLKGTRTSYCCRRRLAGR